jgi:hypothetical protein
LEVGFKKIPSGGANISSSYTLALSDNGTNRILVSGGSIIIPASIFSNGDNIKIINTNTSVATITCSAITTYISGINTVKTSVSLAAKGIMEIFFVDATNCFLSGNIS